MTEYAGELEGIIDIYDDEAWAEAIRNINTSKKATLTINKGGPGSGFYDHAGRPGEIGGSVSDETPIRSLSPKAVAKLIKSNIGDLKKDLLSIRARTGSVMFGVGVYFKPTTDPKAIRSIIENILADTGFHIEVMGINDLVSGVGDTISVEISSRSKPAKPDIVYKAKETVKLTINKGGPGSGHHGHVGRPGKVGGALPGTGTVIDAMRAGKYTTDKDFQFDKGISRAKVVDVAGDGKAIVKEASGGTVGDRSYAEEIAYILSEELGWDLVPPTTIVDDPDLGENASIQQWIENAAAEYSKEFIIKADQQGLQNANELIRALKPSAKDMSRIAILDTLLINSDRHKGNFLYGFKENAGRVFAIDHNLAMFSLTTHEWDSGYGYWNRIYTDTHWNESKLRYSRKDMEAARGLFGREGKFYKAVVDHYGVEAIDSMYDRLYYLNQLITTDDAWSD